MPRAPGPGLWLDVDQHGQEEDTLTGACTSPCQHHVHTWLGLPTHAPHAMRCRLPQAGGAGSTGQQRVLDVQPEKVHQRVPLFIGSKKEVEYLESFTKKH